MSQSLQPNSKSGFIREHLSLTNEQIIEKGADAGHKIKPNLIYMVRSKLKGADKPKKMKRVKAFALRKKNGHVKAKRKYTRRTPVAAASNGRTPVSLRAIVDQFVRDLEAANKQSLRDSLEGLL